MQNMPFTKFRQNTANIGKEHQLLTPLAGHQQDLNRNTDYSYLAVSCNISLIVVPPLSLRAVGDMPASLQMHT